MSEIDPSYQNKELPQIITQLQERIESQERQLSEQRQQIQHLEDRLVASEYKSTKPQWDDQWFNDLKRELVTYVVQQASSRQIGLPPASSQSPVSHVSIAQAQTQAQKLDTLSQKVAKLQQYEQQAERTRAELERVTTDMSSLEDLVQQLYQQFSDRVQGVSFLAEQRQVDTRLLAEIQAELPTVEKKIESSLAAKIDIIERRLPQFGQYQVEIERLRQEWVHERETLNAQVAHRERQMKIWVEQTQSHEHLMGKYDNLFERYTEQYQANKRLVESLQDVQEQLLREKHQARELQRLNEERQQAIFEKWKNDYEQRWQQQSSVWKPTFTELERNIDILQKQAQDTLKFKKAVERQLEIVLQILEEDMYNRTTVAETWQRRFEEIAISE